MSETPVELRIIIEGIIAGILSGIAIETGISVDEGSLSVMILGTFCQATEGINNSFNCWGFVSLLGMTAFVITVISIFSEVTRVDDWRVGVSLYVVGFFMGVILIIAIV